MNCELLLQKGTVLAKILGVYRIGYRNSQTNATLKQDLLVIENLFYDRYTHVHTHKRTHTLTQSHKRMYTHAHIHKHTHACTDIHTLPHTHTYARKEQYSDA